LVKINSLNDSLSLPVETNSLNNWLIYKNDHDFVTNENKFIENT